MEQIIPVDAVLFHILGLDDAEDDLSKIKTNYRLLIMEVHPDKSKYDEDMCIFLSQSLNVAYSILKDELLRHAYIKHGRNIPDFAGVELEALLNIDWLSIEQANVLLGCLLKASEKNDGQFTDEEYVIEHIKDHRLIDGNLEFEIKWLGYRNTTWEPTTHIPYRMLNRYFKTQDPKSELYQLANLSLSDDLVGDISENETSIWIPKGKIISVCNYLIRTKLRKDITISEELPNSNDDGIFLITHNNHAYVLMIRSKRNYIVDNLNTSLNTTMLWFLQKNLGRKLISIRYNYSAFQGRCGLGATLIILELARLISTSEEVPKEITPTPSHVRMCKKFFQNVKDLKKEDNNTLELTVTENKERSKARCTTCNKRMSKAGYSLHKRHCT